jgi:hypothetical protein
MVREPVSFTAVEILDNRQPWARYIVPDRLIKTRKTADHREEFQVVDVFADGRTGLAERSGDHSSCFRFRTEAIISELPGASEMTIRTRLCAALKRDP